ncbi:ATP-binding cassette sub-family A member 2 [Caerostris darwini]|uniref:ATP-binding cassette sub-family A member 2 n=1 Tax=Caerostris darwini TaxID=1538125 RepID=A0AAV4QIM9_9ARAC|nr:ATP-binding cassette sub-family A member 2 [Caerostris darwini]
MPLCLAISWVYSVAMLVQNIVYEKEQRLKEVMKTMGLNSAVHWLAWFITSFLQMSITAACLTIILKYGLVLTYSNPLLIFLMLEIFVVANIVFSCCEEAAHDHIPVWLKSLASLLSTTAFGLGVKYFAFYEEVGVVWYIENVHPGSYGLPKPWYFPFTKTYWFGSMQADADSNCFNDCWRFIKKPKKWGLSVMEEDQAHAMTNRTNPSNLPLGVCIENLVKEYKSGNKVAVNRLSLNLYENQITSFLGHNGAGKTTTMSILTGLFPSSSGYATMYCYDIRSEMDFIRQSMGMCPQHFFCLKS